MAEKQLLQTRLKSINSLLNNNAKQLELTRLKIASILTHPNYQQCQEFIEKIKEKRFTKVRERQVRKLNNLINKKEGGITWQSSQVFEDARAFPWANNRQAGNSVQAGRLTPRASPQASQEDSVLPGNTTYQAGNPQGLLADSTLPPAESAISQAGSPQSSQAGSSQPSLGERALPRSHLSQAGSSQASLVDSTISPADSELSQASSSQSFLEDSTLPQAGSSQASLVDSTISPAESELFQASSSQSSLEDSALPQSNFSQAGSSQASPVDSTLSLAESELSQASSPSCLEDSTLLAESTAPPQAVRCLARLRARQAGTPLGRSVQSLSGTVLFPKGYFPRTMLPKKQGLSPIGTAPCRVLPPWRNLTQSG